MALLGSWYGQQSSVLAAQAPYPSRFKENIQTCMRFCPSKVGKMLSSNIAKLRWWWSFNRDMITGKHLSAILSWPEHCQQRRSMPVTTSLRHSSGAQHSVGKTSRSRFGTPKQLRSDVPLLSQAFFLSFHPHIARFSKHSRGNRQQATTRMVEID